ncbi:hypothetical protein ACGFZS_08855 [Streptomyces sp. NPDC048288]|uniref:hypothetical protein n=1 Tax=Streptomyces sp. NPDC048288 TaxID=3365529 RepID=UPI00371368EE
MTGDDTGKRRTARRSWRDVPLTPIAFFLVGNALLHFLGALFSLAFGSGGFSAGRLADAVLDLVGRLLITGLCLWLFARVRKWRRGANPQGQGQGQQQV